VPLRIAFDLDGVLADMESELVRQAEILFGEAMTHRLQERATDHDHTTAVVAPGEEDAGDVSPEVVVNGQPAAETALDNTPPLLKLNMTSRQQRKLWRHVEGIENFWETLTELEPGLVARLAALAAERRWEVIFLTKRPQTAGSTAQVQTQRWLKSKGFPLPSVFVVQGSRGRIAGALDLHIVIDDRPENCLDVVVDSKARAILVWREEEKHVPAATRRLGIGVVKTTADCLDVLSEIDSTTSQRSGLFDRVRRLLGLKEDSLPA
jgi:phosphoglycolate phosphatase-like HAD superfamily hydrolase